MTYPIISRSCVELFLQRGAEIASRARDTPTPVPQDEPRDSAGADPRWSHSDLNLMVRSCTANHCFHHAKSLPPNCCVVCACVCAYVVHACVPVCAIRVRVRLLTYADVCTQATMTQTLRLKNILLKEQADMNLEAQHCIADGIPLSEQFTEG